MIKISTFIIVMLCSLICSGQHNTELTPDHNSNFRFIGDTTLECSKIIFQKLYDSTKNIHYYKVEKYCAQKKWTKSYGYTKIWWVDFYTQEWKSKWQMGYYWSYTISTHHNEVVFNDIKFKKESIKQLNNL